MAMPPVNPVLQRVAHQSFSLSPSPAGTQLSWSLSPSPAPAPTPRAQSQTPGGSHRLQWDEAMEEAFIEALVTEVERGHRADSGYRKEAWEYAKSEVQRVAGPAKVVTLASCKNKHDNLKKDWKVWVDLTRQSGFGVEDGVEAAASEALEAYFKAHKEARKFRYKPIKYKASLRQLFEGVLATGQDVMAIKELTKESIETNPSASLRLRQGSNREEGFPLVTPRKRSALGPTRSSVRSSKRAATDRIGRELGELAGRFEAFVTVMGKDYQRDAVEMFLKDYEILQPALKFAVVEAFEKEYTAKMFCLMTPLMRRMLVQKEILRRREDIVGKELEGDEFDSVMARIQWDRDGDLVLIEAMEDGGIEN